MSSRVVVCCVPMRCFTILPLIIIVGCGPRTSGLTGTTLSGVPERPQPTQPPTPLGTGVVTGTFGPGDDMDTSDRYNDFYTAQLDEGARVRLFAQGSLDMVIEVYGPDDFAMRNDDFIPGTLDPVVEFEVAREDEYLIRVLPLSPGAQGAYQIGLVNLDPSSGPNLPQGGDSEGSISASGAGLGVAVGAHYWFTARAGERIRIRVTSPAFDTTATMIGPNGQVWSNDDAGDTGEDGSERPLDSTIQAIFPANGSYHLIVAPYGGRGEGAFRLRTTRHEAVVLQEGQQAPSMGFAGSEGEGRILGLFAGLTDYGPRRSRLYGCADDATMLAQAFREANLQSPEQQLVLTDGAANVAAFSSGIERLAAQSTENDVVVIFFSGHGDVEPAEETDKYDLDGTDETIVLFDDEMRDNAVVELINGITANTIILALDSCHSGGFARDFVTRPGRIGMFSSDEDALSDTAIPLRAGGYLSYSLRRGVLGDADNTPRDGVLMAGELTDFMHGLFVQHNLHINPASSNQPRQWFVSRRGSVGWHDILWLYPRNTDGSLRPIPDVPLQSPPAF